MRIPTPRPLIALLLCLAAGVAWSLEGEARPIWIEDPGRMYPSELYIAEVGSADTEEGAKGKAVSRIAMVFESEVSAVDQIVRQYWESDAGDEGALVRSTHLKERLQVSTGQTLSNVGIAHTWFDPETGRHHALATLDRARSAALYREGLRRLDSEVAEFFDGFQRMDDPLARLAFLNRTLSLAAEREMVARQLLVVTMGQSAAQPAIGAARLGAARAELRGRIAARIALDEPPHPAFEAAIRSVLERFGFGVVAEGGDYELRGGLALEPLERRGEFVGWRSERGLVARATGAELVNAHANGREGHLTRAEAERRAERKARMRMTTALAEALEAHLEGLLAR